MTPAEIAARMLRRLASLLEPKRHKRQYLLGDDGTLTEPFRRGKCPDCGGSDFEAGPSGGMCQNVRCAVCGARFNLVVCGPELIAGVERI